MSKTVLFIPHYRESLKTTMLPLALAARRLHGVEPAVVLPYPDSGPSAELLREHGVADYLELGSRLYPGEGPDGAPPEKLAPLAAARRLVRQTREYVSDRRALASQLLDRFDPIAVFEVTEAPRLELFVNAASSARGVPTVLVQWAYTQPRGYFRRVRASRRRARWRESGRRVLFGQELRNAVSNAIKTATFRGLGVRPPRSLGDGNALRFAVMDQSGAEMFRRQGVPSEKLAVTGHPEHDALFEYAGRLDAPAERARARRELGLARDGPVVLYVREAVSHYALMSEERDKQVVREVLGAAGRTGGAQVVLKMHPRDDAGYYGFVGAEFPTVVLLHDCDMAKLVAVSDIFLSQGSSTTLWAHALGVPVVLLGMAGTENTSVMARHIGVEPVASSSELVERLRRPAARAQGDGGAGRRGAAGLDGRATERILALAGLNEKVVG